MNHLQALQQLHTHFKATGKIDFRSCRRDPIYQDRHHVHFDLKDTAGSTLGNLILEIEMDRAILIAELNKIDPKGILDIFEDDEKMDAFMEFGAFQLVQHLKAFNGQADDYPAIAELAHNWRGGINLNKYNI